MSGEPISEAFADELVAAARTAVGDELRSVVYFDLDDYEQLYLRSDLESDADLDAFVTNERLGFTSQVTYGDSELGAYLYTIRAFDRGFLTRVVGGDHGVFVTTDEMSIERFEETSTALRGVIEEHRGQA